MRPGFWFLFDFTFWFFFLFFFKLMAFFFCLRICRKVSLRQSSGPPSGVFSAALYRVFFFSFFIFFFWNEQKKKKWPLPDCLEPPTLWSGRRSVWGRRQSSVTEFLFLLFFFPFFLFFFCFFAGKGRRWRVFCLKAFGVLTLVLGQGLCLGLPRNLAQLELPSRPYLKLVKVEVERVSRRDVSPG